MNDIDFANKIINNILEITGNEGKKIPIHEPNFKNTNAKSYVNECIDTGWVSTAGRWVEHFESQICQYTGSKYAIAVSNGTVGLRLALFLVGVQSSEEVIIPPMSFVATANSISHLGAVPHFVDIEEDSLGMCPKALKKRLEEVAVKKEGLTFNRISGKRIAAVLPVHVFGNPSKIIEISDICEEWNLPLVEDAAEALGSWVEYQNQKIHCGLFGDVSVISFNGNKVISTGGGGVLITNNHSLAKRARHLSTTAKINHPWNFDHDEIGWNDRLPNINAALGASQMEVLEEKLASKRKLYEKYLYIFRDMQGLEVIKESINCLSNHWLISIVLKEKDRDKLKETRDLILSLAHEKDILLRPSWNLLNNLKMYINCPSGDLEVAQDQAFRIINLPSSPQLLD